MKRFKRAWEAYLASRWAPLADAVLCLFGLWLFIVMMFVM